MEQGSTDIFAITANTAPPALPTKYISTKSIDVDEAIQFKVDTLEIVPDRFDDGEGKVIEITGTVLESRASRFSDGADVVITCKALRLEQMGNAVAESGADGAVVTLVRGEDENKAAGWRWTIEHPADGEFALGSQGVE